MGAGDQDIKGLLENLQEDYQELSEEDKISYHILAIMAALTTEPERN